MAEFVVNAVLIVALLVLLIIWAVSASRRRNRARREHADDRRLMLAAFTGAAAPAAPAATTSEDEPPPARRAEGSTGGRQPAAVPGQPLDAASVAGLLALLEGHRPALRGVITGLLTSPSSVWSAGARAGQTVGRRTMADQPGPATEPNSNLYREAAAELVDIHAHDLSGAHREFTRYAAAVGDRTLAELYVRSATYATYPEHDQVLRVVTEITDTARPTGSVR